MKKIIECVPNFSEGNNMAIIQQIADAISNTSDVKLLDIDPGKATNRTVITFVGDENSVVQGAFNAIKKAQELIDMSKHKGEHPRFGATDVCPFIPIANATMEDCIACAKALGKLVGEQLNIPAYLYEYAASAPHRKNLASVRSGEYEGIADKIKQADWKPDFGPAAFNEKSGNIAIGARDLLIAYNTNLNTTSTRRANSVAFDIREQGRVKKDDAGKTIKDANGEDVRTPGTCKSVKGIGWYIEEYGIAQVSMNLTNINDTPLHIAFDECNKSAFNRGMRVTGSELVGLVPLKSMLDAGKYFLEQQQRSTGVSDSELIKIAIKSMGLDELSPFDPQKKIIEYVMKDTTKKKLVDMNLVAFADETASESPAPGGGSIAAYAGAMGVALGTMVANLSSHKVGWDHRWKEFSDWAEQGQKIKDKLLFLVDEDTNAFNKIMDAFSLPKTTDEEKSTRTKAIQDATKYAIEIPFEVMKTAYSALPMIKEMAANGNPNSVSDAGVGALCIRTAVFGAYLNVKINASGLKDKEYLTSIMNQVEEIKLNTEKLEQEILDIVSSKM
jgi:glutamate formiminotransferase/formiminotetrahydrofolate cyclodeaminase